MEALLDGPRARGAFLLASPARPAVVAAHRGRGAADGARRPPGQRVAVSRRRTSPRAAWRATSRWSGDRTTTRSPTTSSTPRRTSWSIRAAAARAQPTAGGCGTSGRSASGPGGIARTPPACCSSARTRARARRASRCSRRCPTWCSWGRVSWRPRSCRVLAAEMQVEAPGQRVLLDRLLDALLIAALRTWFAAQQAEAPGWFRAQQDPAVARVLTLLHEDVAHPWTVSELADQVGVSRAALARRFTALVGEPPMAYLAELAARPRRRPAGLVRRDHHLGGAPGRLRNAVLAQRRVQAQLRREPAALPPDRVSRPDESVRAGSRPSRGRRGGWTPSRRSAPGRTRAGERAG